MNPGKWQNSGGDRRAVSMLFVCLGNICRSPLAEGALESLARERGLSRLVRVDSAGTGGWHAGSPPDPRSVAVAAEQGVDISAQRARKVTREDHFQFDVILAMDRSVLADLQRLRPDGATARIELYLAHATGKVLDVPDPYYGGEDGFREVYRMIRGASEALLDRLEWRSG